MDIEIAKIILWKFTRADTLKHISTAKGDGDVWRGDGGGIFYIGGCFWHTTGSFSRPIPDEFELVETIAKISKKALMLLHNPKFQIETIKKFKPPSSNG